MEDCVFCKIIAGKIPSERVMENDDFIVIKDINQDVPGHSLIIPKKHYDDFIDMPKNLYDSFLSTVKMATEKLETENFNLVLNNGKASGQLVQHVHMHILPRKEGDGFKLGV